jgi:hypothetical protein
MRFIALSSLIEIRHLDAASRKRQARAVNRGLNDEKVDIGGCRVAGDQLDACGLYDT